MQPLRVAELLAGLSLVADVGMGLEPGEAGRAGLVAMELAAVADAPDPGDVYYTALLQHVGCTAYAHEAARMLGGDELAVKRAAVHTDFARPRDVARTYLPHLAPSARLATRVAAAGTAAVRARRGGAALGVLDSVEDPVAAVVGAEPRPALTFSAPNALDRICRAFGEVVDIKSPLHHGHCTGVAALASMAAERSGLAAVDVSRAALVHDLGRASVPNGVWERPGPLSWPAQERMRLHAYHSERVLARCGPLASIARLAGTHHERLDGSGYHRGAGAAGLGPAERLLAAADVLHALTEHRAHRPARTADEAVVVLTAEAVARRLDPDAVRAVVEAAGGSARRVPALRPAGLTERQVEVLRLLARGLSNPQIARRLVISRRTAEHHVQDVYARIGVSSRAAAALYALAHDLLPKDG